jgi:hypothetical protein
MFDGGKAGIVRLCGFLAVLSCSSLFAWYIGEHCADDFLRQLW